MAGGGARAEHWLPVLGYEGIYEVSDEGRVRSVDRINVDSRGISRRIQGKMMRLKINQKGYFEVGLQKGAGPKFFPVHRLVLEAFVGPAPEKTVCCHNNGNRLDNRVSNLRWDTSRSNSFDVVKHGNHKDANKTHCIRGHLFEGPNLHIRNKGSRMCVACNRAHAHVGYHKELKPRLKEISDSYYEKIMSGQ